MTCLCFRRRVNNYQNNCEQKIFFHTQYSPLPLVKNLQVVKTKIVIVIQVISPDQPVLILQSNCSGVNFLLFDDRVYKGNVK